MGHSNAAASMTALVFSRMFDLSRTYFIVAGVGGIDPALGTLGSTAWARYLVEFGIQWEIDARDIPVDWTRAGLAHTVSHARSRSPAGGGRHQARGLHRCGRPLPLRRPPGSDVPHQPRCVAPERRDPASSACGDGAARDVHGVDLVVTPR